MDRLTRLRHDTVVGGDHQHHDVGGLGTTGTHRRECLVARRVEEGDHALLRLDVIGADVLGDAAHFAGCNLRRTDVVEQRGLAVIDVTHHGHHRCARLEWRIGGLFGRFEESVRIVELGRHRLVAHFLDHDHRGLLVEHLVDRDHAAHLHHRLDDFGGLDRHLVGEVGDRDGLGHVDLAHDRLGRCLEGLLLALGATTAATAAAARTTFPGAADIRATGLQAAATARRIVLPATTALGVLALLRWRLVGLVQGTRGALGLGFGRLFARGFLLGTTRFGCRPGAGLPFLLFLQIGGLACCQIGRASALAFTGGQFFLAEYVAHRQGCTFGRLRLRLRFAGAGGFLRGLERGHGGVLDRCRCRFGNHLGLGHHLDLRLRRCGRQLVAFRNRDGLLGACLEFGFGFGLRLGFRQQLVALDEDALLADLDLHGTRAAGGIGSLDLAGLLARQRDLRLRRGFTVGSPQVFEQACLVLLGEQILCSLLLDARFLELLEKDGCRHAQFAGELGDAHLIHSHSSVIARTSAPAQP